jgi:hypothetical protein
MPKLAVLIDADNARYSVIDLLLSEIAKYGTAHVKRAYGDWTSPNLKGWKDELLKQSIQPIQQFVYTHGKNATDTSMIIDAMDLLYTSRFDGFCLRLSPATVTLLGWPLVSAIWIIVYGFGERQMPKPFVAACDKFIYTENLVHLEDLLPHANKPTGTEIHSLALQEDHQLASQLRTTVETASDDDGWARLCKVGQLLTRQYPDFDSRTYGYSKLSDLITASSWFETARRSPRHGLPKEICVRYKHRKRKSFAE